MPVVTMDECLFKNALKSIRKLKRQIIEKIEEAAENQRDICNKDFGIELQQAISADAPLTSWKISLRSGLDAAQYLQWQYPTYESEMKWNAVSFQLKVSVNDVGICIHDTVYQEPSAFQSGIYSILSAALKKEISLVSDGANTSEIYVETFNYIMNAIKAELPIHFNSIQSESQHCFGTNFGHIISLLGKNHSKDSITSKTKRFVKEGMLLCLKTSCFGIPIPGPSHFANDINLILACIGEPVLITKNGILCMDDLDNETDEVTKKRGDVATKNKEIEATPSPPRQNLQEHFNMLLAEGRRTRAQAQAAQNAVEEEPEQQNPVSPPQQQQNQNPDEPEELEIDVFVVRNGAPGEPFRHREGARYRLRTPAGTVNVLNQAAATPSAQNEPNESPNGDRTYTQTQNSLTERAVRRNLFPRKN